MRDESLIYDVGMHKGEDTSFYLAKGFRVVAIEADPALAAHARHRFADAIATGTLLLIEGAVVPGRTSGNVTFYKNTEVSVWGTTDPDWAARNAARGAPSMPIEVPIVDLDGLLRDVGVPRYMKVDIEGCDMHCLDVLKSHAEKPRFVSIEAALAGHDEVDKQIDALARLGYDRFQAAQQALVHRVRLAGPSDEGRSIAFRFERGSSGPFGSDLAGIWRDASQVKADFERIAARNRRFGEGTVWRAWRALKPVKSTIEWALRTRIPGWYDIHAWHRDARTGGQDI